MDSSNLRQKAEEILKNKASVAGSYRSEADLDRLIHELEVHQIELELQNEELGLAKEREADLAKEKYIELYDFAPSGYYTLSREGVILDLNLTGAKMLGKERLHLKNSRFGFFVTDDTRLIFNHFLEKVFYSKSKEECEVLLSTIDNFSTYAHLTGIAAANGEQCFVTSVDISKRKLAEISLRNNEEQYQKLFDHMLSGLMVCELIFNEAGIPIDHRFIQGNPAFEKLTGLTVHEQIGKTGKELAIGWPPEVVQRLYKVALTRESIQYERYNETLGRYYETRVFSPRRGQFAHIFIDITERKKAETALQESETRFRSLFDNSIVGISVAGPDGSLLHANNAYARMYGYENQEMLLAEVINIGQFYAKPEDRKEILRILRLNKKIENMEVEVVRRDGHRFFVLVSAGEVRDNDGNLLYCHATHIDLTERKILEEEKKQAQEKLLAYATMLQESREDERALISREIHDQLGQSMTALKLDLNWLQVNLTANAEIKEKLSNMVALVTETIRDVQRISSELRPGILDDLGLSAAIEWYTEEFGKRTGLEVLMDLDEVQTKNDKKNLAMFRLLQEALTNVIRHAHAKRVKVTLHKTAGNIILKIVDDGIGIPAEKIQSIHSLGLIGMQERVKQAGGTIEFLSGENPGTKIRISIPVGDSSETNNK